MNYPEQITVKERAYKVNYQRGLRATSTVRIKRNQVFLTLSRYVRGEERDEIVRKFLIWAEKRLEKVKTELLLPEYKDGGRIVLHNKVYEIKVEQGSRNRVKFIEENIIVVRLNGQDFFDQEKLRDLVEKFIMKDQISYLKEVLNELNQLYFQGKYGQVRFKRMNSRFGSCSSKGNINIAYRLLFAPREVFRYVCIHELAHLKEFNHSKRFWALVEEAMPNYKEAEKWLRESGFVLG